MVAVSAPPRLFPLLEDGHPFAAQVRALADMIAERAAGLPEPQVVHAEIKALPQPDGSWRLDRFYWSGQRWGGPGPVPFAAHTLAYSEGRGATWHSFPQDSYLGDLGAAFASLQAAHPAARVEVLRYVPLRRLTFRLAQQGQPGLVGKFKRRSRFRAADERLAAVAQATAGRALEFRVARPAGVNPELGLTLQEGLAGLGLPGLIDHRSIPALMARLGQTHRALHELDVPGVPAWDTTAFRAGTARDLGWIAFLRPELAEELAQIGRQIEEGAPDLGPATWTFCHGDFVPSQILVDDGPWGVIDFDLCRLGDPYQELGILLAALPYDVPTLRGAAPLELERAGAAYLAGYAERAGCLLDLGQLRWHRLCAEVYYLGLALKKDWLDEAGFEGALGRLRTAADQLQHGGSL